jgi:protease I
MASKSASRKPKPPKGTHPDRKVAFILASMFEDAEFRIPFERLRAAGYPVEVIGAKAGEELKGVQGRELVKTDKAIDEAKPWDYAALVIPGGFSPDKLRADRRFVEFVKAFDAQGRPIAAICHGPQLLEAAHLVQGRTLTAWATVQDDLRQMGAEVQDQPVVTDGNWITSRKPEDGEHFAAAILEALEREAAGPGAQANPWSTPRKRKTSGGRPRADVVTSLSGQPRNFER